MADGPSRFQVIEGGGQQRESMRPKRERKPSGKHETRKLFICQPCVNKGTPSSGLRKVRLGAWDVNGRLKGGEDWGCCDRCGHPHYKIRSYD